MSLQCWQLSWWRIRLQCRRPWFDSWVRKIPWRRDRLPTPVFLGFPGSSVGKESTCNVGELGSIPGLGRSPGGGHGNPLYYSCLENPHGQRSLVGYSLWGRKESDTTERLSLFHFLFNVGVHRLSFLPLSFLSREPPPFLDVQIPPDVLVAPRSHFPAQISIPSSKYMLSATYWTF